MRGTFSGPVKATWLPDGRTMVIDEALTYTDNVGVVWTAPAGSRVDGASIPRFFWRFIGSPFCGRYRRASVIHDVYCVIRTAPWQSVHRLFAEMMAADGVPYMRRKLMAAAVWYGGPRWVTQNEREAKYGNCATD